jgi:hypothetical protein
MLESLSPYGERTLNNIKAVNIKLGQDSAA